MRDGFHGLVLIAIIGSAACVSETPGLPDAETPDSTAADTGSGSDGQQGMDSGLMGCPGRVPDDVKGVFVAQNGTDMNACGTRMSPCKTIQFGIAQATQAMTKSIVYVAANNMPYVESIAMNAGVSIEGGWSAAGSTWTPVCDSSTSSAVTIQGVTNKTVTASFAGAATLRFVTLTSKAAAAGESLYGVFATGAMTDLTLDQVGIKIDDGGAGANGMPGQMGAGGAMPPCTASDGSNGSTGPDGMGAMAGTFSATGYTPANGGDGTIGVDGNNGTAGGAAVCDSNCKSCKGGLSCTIGSANICSTAGQAGCGGKAGTQGTGGGGGGASVAVFTFDANVTIFSGTFASGNGGKGGDGGQGAGGGSGSAGVAGMSATCVTGWTCTNGQCVQQTTATMPGGSKGGTGGTGGTGGNGGGGSGGPSYAAVVGMAAKLTLNKTPMLVHGSGGAGGMAGGAMGQSGDMFAF